MKKIVSTLNLSREEWLKYRKKGICGTDAGAITGFNPYVSALVYIGIKQAMKYQSLTMRQ